MSVEGRAGPGIGRGAEALGQTAGLAFHFQVGVAVDPAVDPKVAFKRQYGPTRAWATRTADSSPAGLADEQTRV